MRNATIVPASEPFIRQIVRETFPDFRGREVALVVFAGPVDVSSYWDGGSRQWFAAINLSSMRSVNLPSTNPTQGNFPVVNDLPDGVALIERSCFCGSHHRLRIHVRSENMNAAMLPPAEELDEDELLVLAVSCTLKSSYAGISGYRRHCLVNERGMMTGDRFDSARDRLISRRLLSKSGAVTISGRNAAEAARAAGRRIPQF